MKKKYLKVSPELWDGSAWTIIDYDRPEVLSDLIEAWRANDPFVGDSFTVELVEMTEEEVEVLPEV